VLFTLSALDRLTGESSPAEPVVAPRRTRTAKAPGVTEPEEGAS
jgi:hypothetical protein